MHVVIIMAIESIILAYLLQQYAEIFGPFEHRRQIDYSQDREHTQNDLEYWLTCITFDDEDETHTRLEHVIHFLIEYCTLATIMINQACVHTLLPEEKVS